jgi:hypothetical protein
MKYASKWSMRLFIRSNEEKMMRFPMIVPGLPAVAMAFAILSGSVAQAAPTTFFGEDLNPGGDPHILSAFPNSVAARNSFFLDLVGVGTETFDSFSVGTNNPTATFNVPSGTVQATLNGGTIAAGSDGAGRYPISSPNYLFAGTSSFAVTFSQPIAAFGFFGTDIGDFGGTLSLTLTDTSHVVTHLTVPNLLGTCGGTPCSDPTSGSVLYFGFFDTGDTYTSIAFTNNSSVDNFGFDNFSVGTLAQVVPTPEPASLVMLGSAVAGLVMARRRRT